MNATFFRGKFFHRARARWSVPVLGALILLGPGWTASAALVNRWLFTNPPGVAPAATAVADSLGGTAATIRGNGASFTGTALVLPGGSTGNARASEIAAYLDLPNGIISSKTNLTVEAWLTPLSSKDWQRIFDFGRTNVTVGTGAATGEIIDGSSLPGVYTGTDSLMLSLNMGTALGNQSITGIRANTRSETSVDLTASTSLNARHHYALTVADGAGSTGATGCRVIFYRDGQALRTLDLPSRLPNLTDVNNWIGRSQFGGDQCANFTLEELRIYDHAAGAAEVLAHFNEGPRATIPPPTAVADSVTMHRGQKVRIAVQANDTGENLTGPAVVVTPPSYGTAEPDADGNILYTHTTGSPASDRFTYTVTGLGGVSAPGTVTVNFADTLRIASAPPNIPSTPPPLDTSFTPVVTGLVNPLCIASPAGEARRVFICEKIGHIRLVDDLAAPAPAATFLDLAALLGTRGETLSAAGEQGLLGLAFHPSYATNRNFYVFYSVQKAGGSAIYERVSRFTAQAGNASAADLSSELVLIEQLDPANNHNGGDLHFGPDGFLYISLGDGGDANDSLGLAQKIDGGFFSGLLRIDVDRLPGSVEPTASAAIPRDGGVARYAIPADNPFVGATTFNGSAIDPAKLRAEFWAVGLRNPWRFSFDSSTGDLWLGDVGQDTWEEVDIVTKGGNYGWSFREGNHPGPRAGAAPANFDATTHRPPLYEYSHYAADPLLRGNSVTGGVVYRGTRFPQLTGAYVFADWASGNVWTLTRNGSNAPTVRRIGGLGSIAGFGTDPANGDILAADLNGRIVRITFGEGTSDRFPATLGETGLFADLRDLSPAPGLIPYEVNLPFWSDYAIKQRWFTIPGANDRMTWSREGSWTFPTGEIWVKHFDLETTRGKPTTKKRIETRVLVKTADGVYGVSYRWNDDETDATLVDGGGDEFDVPVRVGGRATTQRWRIPARSECVTCHSPQGGYALSFNTRQLNLTGTSNGFTGNQIALLNDAGYFANAPDPIAGLPRHSRPDESAFPLEDRVRSYLAVNCSYCHQPGGGAQPATWDGRASVSLAAMGLIDAQAIAGGGDSADRLIAPGAPAHSIVLDRMAELNGFTRMPPLASNELDRTNIALMRKWITGLPKARRPLVADPGAQTSLAGEVVNLPLAASDAYGFPLTFTATGLPAGLSIDSSTGLISGTLDASGKWTAIVSVANRTLRSVIKIPWLVKPNTGLAVEWTTGNVGGPALAGGGSFASGSYTISGAGSGLGGMSDQLGYVWQPFVGDGEFIARLTAQSATGVKAGAGLMFRETLQANSRLAFVAQRGDGALAFQSRAVTAARISLATIPGYASPDNWLRVVRSGNTFAGYGSSDGATWKQIGWAPIAMSRVITAGFAVTAGAPALRNEVMFSNASFVAGTLPAPWLSAEIGAPQLTEIERFDGGSLTIRGGGAGFVARADAGHFVSRKLAGDGEIVAHLASSGTTPATAQAALMVRESSAPGSRFALVSIAPQNNLSFSTRAAPHGLAVISAAQLSADRWLRLARTGKTFTAYHSPDGVTWTALGSATMTMGGNSSVGLAVSGTDDSLLYSATFDHVEVR